MEGTLQTDTMNLLIIETELSLSQGMDLGTCFQTGCRGCRTNHVHYEGCVFSTSLFPYSDYLLLGLFFVVFSWHNKLEMKSIN